MADLQVGKTMEPTYLHTDGCEYMLGPGGGYLYRYPDVGHDWIRIIAPQVPGIVQAKLTSAPLAH